MNLWKILSIVTIFYKDVTHYTHKFTGVTDEASRVHSSIKYSYKKIAIITSNEYYSTTSVYRETYKLYKIIF